MRMSCRCLPWCKLAVVVLLGLVQTACVDVNAPLESGELPLVKAAEERDAAGVKSLLEAGADPNLCTEKGNRPLWIALLYGRGEMEVVQSLLDAGAKVEAEDVARAAASSYPQYLRAVLDAGGVVPRCADVRNGIPIWNSLGDFGPDKDGRDTQACARLLEERGISYHDPVYAHYPLHSAALSNSVELAGWLLDKGFDVNARDDAGATPLMMNPDGVETARLLLARGAEVNAQDKAGNTALMQNFMTREVMQVLLNAGANPNICNAKGETALMYYLHHPEPTGGMEVQSDGSWLHWSGVGVNPELIQMLVEAGVDVNKADAGGETPIQAAQAYTKEVRQILRRAGAKLKL